MSAGLDVATRSLRSVEPCRHVIAGQIELIEVVVEPLRDPPPAIEHKRADKSSGAVSASLKYFGEGRDRVVDIEAAVVADTVKRWERTRKE
jgi:hypothetical protein